MIFEQKTIINTMAANADGVMSIGGNNEVCGFGIGIMSQFSTIQSKGAKSEARIYAISYDITVRVW